MATYNAAAGDRAVHDKTLVANTADTVTFQGIVAAIEIVTDGAAKLYVTTDGTAATVSGAKTFILPASASTRTIKVHAPNSPSISLISSGTPTYSVTHDPDLQ